MVPEHLQPYVDRLRQAYPDGVPGDEYYPLLAAVYDDFSERNLGDVVGELIDEESVVVTNDGIKAMHKDRPPEADIERVRQKLLAVGWVFEED